MKSIKNYPNYTINTDGSVFSKNRDKFLKPDIGPKGYSRVTLCNEGIPKKFLVHRLVAEHFIPNPEGKECINHIDNDPANNTITNLEWVTPSENMLHSHKQGRCSNLLASEAARQSMETKMISKFKKILSNNFIDYVTENKRGIVTFQCSSCTKTPSVRTDSTLIAKCLCNSCSRKMKI